MMANTKSYRVMILAVLARLMGVQFKIDGMPFGAKKSRGKLTTFGSTYVSKRVGA